MFSGKKISLSIKFRILPTNGKGTSKNANILKFLGDPIFTPYKDWSKIVFTFQPLKKLKSPTYSPLLILLTILPTILRTILCTISVFFRPKKSLLRVQNNFRFFVAVWFFLPLLKYSAFLRKQLIKFRVTYFCW